MLESLLKAIRLRLVIVFLIIHFGLIFSIYGLAEASSKGLHGHSYWILLTGIIGLYGGVLLGALFIFLPLYSISQKIRWFLNWKEWILRDLPQILALIPSIITAIKTAFQKPQSNQTAVKPESKPGNSTP